MARWFSNHWFQFALVIIISQMASAAYAVAPGTPASGVGSSNSDAVFAPKPSSPPTARLIAQIIPDNTLGNKQSTILNNNEQIRINGGVIQGPNLFHSFEAFNINPGQQVYFANPDDIQTILGRVTGDDISDIDGLLGVDGTANLFLLNPNGISFGPNAQLDIRGSFTASTADAIMFADDSTFSAINPQGISLLTMSVPLGVQFSDRRQGTISNQGILETGQDFTLSGQELDLKGQLTAGGDLTLQAQDSITIRDTEADAFIARSARNLTIQGNQAIDILTLQHLEQLPFVSGGDLVLISDGAISADAQFESGGNVQFLTLGGIPGNFVSLYDPIISANGDVILGNYIGTALKIEATGSIQTGNIRITGPDLLLQADGSGSDEDLLASSQAVILRAGIDGLSGNEPPETIGGMIVPTGTTTGNPAGSIVVNRIDTSNNDGEDGGPIILAANGNITVIEDLVSFSQAFTGNAGNGGNISISSTAGDILINGRLNTFSFSQPGAIDGKNGGDITLSAELGDISTLGDLKSFSSSADGNSSSGGTISIIANSGNILVEGTLETNSSANNDTGNGGNILLSSESGNILINGILRASSQSDNGSSGLGGNISISSGSGNIVTNGRLVTFSFVPSSPMNVGNADNGGDIAISSDTGNIVLNERINSFSSSSSGNASSGGKITISAELGDISTFGDLESFSSSAVGNSNSGGTISIIANSGNILVEGTLEANSSANNDAGNGGNILISSESGNIVANDILRASSQSMNGSSGPGGNISISSGSGDIVTNGRLATFSFAPSLTDIGNADNGGNIAISSDAGNIVLNERINSFSSSSLGNSSNGGDITIMSISGDISTKDVDSSSSLFVQNTPIGITPLDTSTGNGGNILIRSTSGDIVTDGFLSSSSFSRDGDVGNGGNISLITSDGAIVNDSQISAIAISEIDGITGSGGNVTLQANSISDLEISTISSAGASGNVTIRGTDSNLTVDNLRLITSGQLEISNPIFPEQPISLDLSDFDQSGETIITSANNLTLNNVELLSDANRAADAGNVQLRSNGSLQLNDSEIFSDTKDQSSGNGGDIIIAGTNSVVLNNSTITTNTNGDGRAGSILITAPLLTVQNDTTITGETSSPNPEGIGGDILLQANDINLSGEETRISVNTNDIAAAGNITLLPLAEDSLHIFTLDNGPQISASTAAESTGRGGNITIRDADTVLLSNTEIVTSGDGSGTAGSIFIQGVGEFIMRRGSLILAAANQTGRGGNVDIDAGFILTIPAEDNDILATANVGEGGTVSITANLINGFREVELFDPNLRGNRISDISARSNFGFDGTVTLESEPNPELTELPTNLTDPANRIAQTCSTEVGAIVDGLTGDFRITGRGGQLLSPTDIASQYEPLDDFGPATVNDELFSLSDNEPLSSNPQPVQAPLLDSQDAVVTPSGDIFLVAEHRWHPPSSCAP